MDRQLDAILKIEKGKYQTDTWFSLDREWIPTDIDKFLEDSGWEFSYYEDNKDYDYYFIYNGVSHKNEGYTLTFCWNGFTRTNEICISEVEQTEE